MANVWWLYSKWLLIHLLIKMKDSQYWAINLHIATIVNAPLSKYILLIIQKLMFPNRSWKCWVKSAMEVNLFFKPENFDSHAIVKTQNLPTNPNKMVKKYATLIAINIYFTGCLAGIGIY